MCPKRAQETAHKAVADLPLGLAKRLTHWELAFAKTTARNGGSSDAETSDFGNISTDNQIMATKPWHKLFARNEDRDKEEGPASAPSETVSQGVQLDNPISRGEDDTLERTRLASHFAENVLSLNPEQGVVVGVIGPWGSGKTSFINLARNTLSQRGAPVLDFNPWMFSGTEQLVDAFFRELAAQLRLKEELASLAGQIEEYGDLFSKFSWLPVVGQFAALSKPLTSIIGKSLKSKQQGVGYHRARLEKALKALKKPVVVVLDDIDRLSRGEIRDMFKLVRLTANFPNVIYIVAFDRLRVERALSDEDLSGRDYLEKILQVTIDLPQVPFELLGRQVLNSIEDALKDVENAGPFDNGLWPDVFVEIVRPLIRTPRDVRRYAVSLRATVLALGGEIELTDILALEAVRTFLPDLFQRMHGALAGLTTTSDSVRYDNERARLKGIIERLLETSGDHQNILRAVITRLFPAARWHIENNHFGNDFKRTWLRERRVAHEDILRLYLERTPTAAFSSFTDAEKAFGLMTDEVAFAAFLRSLDVQRLQDVISALETFQENFTPDMVVPSTVVLVSLLSELPERQRGMFEMDANLVVGRVVLRLMRSLSDPAQVEAAVSALLPQINSLRGRLRVIDIVGHRVNVGHKLVSSAAAAGFAREWRTAVRSASLKDLVDESDLLFTLYWARRDIEPNEEPITVPDDPQIMNIFLCEARTEAMSNSMGSRAVRRHPYLQWEILCDVLDGEETLKMRLAALRVSGLATDAELMDLADRFAAGWRPDRFAFGA